MKSSSSPESGVEWSRVAKMRIAEVFLIQAPIKIFKVLLSYKREGEILEYGVKESYYSVPCFTFLSSRAHA